MTPAAVPIFVEEPTATVAAMQQAIAAGATLVELRCDRASQEITLACVRAALGLGTAGRRLHTIVTVRPLWEGGKCDAPEHDRVAMLLAALGAGADYVDIELGALRRGANVWPRFLQAREIGGGHQPKIIVSSHDFSDIPADIPAQLEALRHVPGADVLKLVWKARSVADAVTALDLMRRQTMTGGPPLLALAMGEFGQPSRLLGAAFGAPFTFATLPGTAGSAPGQPPLPELLSLYHWRGQDAHTQIFGVIGYPLGHSLSPLIHNAGLQQQAVNAVYVPVLVERGYENFSSAMDALRNTLPGRIGGLSITIPHKENALRYIQEHTGKVEPLAGRIGAVNTLLMEPNGAMEGLNSDLPGFLHALCAGMNIRPEELAGRTAAILGAGGAARAVAAALADQGAQVVVYNRTHEKADALARSLGGFRGTVTAAPWEALQGDAAKIFVNCTPLGMAPNIDTPPMPAFDFTPRSVVFDTVYNPLETRLLRDAHAAGAVTIPGLEMFVQQAAVQFERFTGRNAPAGLFRNRATAALEVK